MRLRDIAFAMIILALAYVNYVLSKNTYFAFLSLLLLGTLYLEYETVILWRDVRTGKLKLWENRIPQFKETYEVIKWWLTIMLPLTFCMTSIVFALRDSSGIYPWVLLTLFMWAFAFILVSFVLFLSQIKNDKPMGSQILLNSLFLWLFMVITGLLSGFVASFFKISPFEDLAICILPIFVYDLLRLDFIRNSIFSINFSSLEQAVRLLDLNEEKFTENQSKEISSMKSKVESFLQEEIVLSRLESEILSEVNSEKKAHAIGSKIMPHNLESRILTQEATIRSLQKEGELLIFSGPFSVTDKTFIAVRFLSREITTGFAVLELESLVTVSDMETIRKVATCSTLLCGIEKLKATGMRSFWRRRVAYILLKRMNRVIGKQILSNVSKWLSSLDPLEKKKHETNIDLDITALLDHILERSLFYNSLTLRNYEKDFTAVPSYEAAFLLIRTNQRELDLYEKEVAVWTRREDAAKRVSPELLGSGFLVRSSEKAKERFALKLQLSKEQMISFDNELQTLLTVVRTQV